MYGGILIFLPSEIAPQMRHLGFTLPTDGSADQELDARLFGYKIDASGLQLMAQERLQQLRWMLTNESRVDMAAENSEQDPEKDEHSDSEKDKHSDSDEEHDPVDAFRQAVQSERQVALLVDGDTEHVPFLIEDVCPGQGPGLAPLRIHWYSPASKKCLTGLGKWTPDYLPCKGKKLEPSIE
jgi:hypothetical protein